MDLREYMFRERLMNRQMAERIDMSLSYLVMVKLGKKKPSLRLAKRISAATNGQVTVEELRK